MLKRKSKSAVFAVNRKPKRIDINTLTTTKLSKMNRNSIYRISLSTQNFRAPSQIVGFTLKFKPLLTVNQAEIFHALGNVFVKAFFT